MTNQQALVAQPESLLSQIVSAAREPGTNPQTIRELWEIAKEVREFDARQAFFAAMKAAQDEMKPIVRRSENPQTHSKYAKLEAIDKAIKPIYQKHGFAIMWSSPMVVEGNKVLVSCDVVHSAGYSKPFTLPGPLDIAGIKGNASKTEMHGLGSSLSYLKRYLKCFIFDLTMTDEDDDAQGAQKYITDEHLDLIEKAIDACKLNAAERGNFEKFMGVQATGDILDRDFERARAHLQDIYRMKKAGK